MKTSSIVLIVIGVLLLILQYGAYSSSDFQFPPLHKGHDFMSTFAGSVGSIIGFNTFGLLGLVLIIIGVARKSKPK